MGAVPNQNIKCIINFDVQRNILDVRNFDFSSNANIIKLKLAVQIFDSADWMDPETSKLSQFQHEFSCSTLV